MDEEKIANSFQKIRQDINFIKQEITSLKNNISTISEGLYILLNQDFKEERPAHNEDFQINNAQNPADKSVFKPQKGQNLPLSIGNEGVPTDRQTDRQTDRHINLNLKDRENSIENTVEMLDSLDSAKKEIRLKFKRLTNQEFVIFSTLYQMEEEGQNTNYKSLSEKMNLTESSIRDYIGRLVQKGIPIIKKKINNKNIVLSISPSLKRLTSLSTILQLRDL